MAAAAWVIVGVVGIAAGVVAVTIVTRQVLTGLAAAAAARLHRRW